MAEQRSPYSLDAFLDFVSNNFLVILIAGLALIGGFFTGSLWTENKLLASGAGSAVAGAGVAANPAAAPAGPTGPTADQLAGLPEIDKDDHVRGNRNAKVMLVEYSDFECPFCMRFRPTLEQVLDEYGDDVALTYRHYPLTFHPQAQKAAEASECVYDQGGDDAFWAFHDAIFDENSALGGTLTAASITTAAEATGVNMDKFQSCLDSGDMADRVGSDFTEGSAAGVSGTPATFVVTGDGAQEMIGGQLPFESVTATIEQYL